MGWGRMLLLGNLGQQLDIEDQRREIRELKAELRRARGLGGGSVERRLYALEAENDSLSLSDLQQAYWHHVADASTREQASI